MQTPVRTFVVRWATAWGVMAFALACQAAPEHAEETQTPPAAVASASESEQLPPNVVTISHLAPARDSIGGLPDRFEWTPVEGADFYVIGVWNDVDRLLWKQDDLHGPSIARPEQLDLDAGTYFWRVEAIRDNQIIGDSGWAAFIVRR